MIIASAATFATAYTAYRHHDGYRRRAQLLQQFPQPVIVVGCGFGFLVKELERLGLSAWGIDVSLYCWTNRVTDRFTLYDILLGPPPLTSMGTIVTESMLEWLTDEEALIAAKNCAATGAIVLHFVTEQGQVDYNYHSAGYWTSLTGQLTFSLEGM